MKAIVTTSANPFHYGHYGLYQEAIKIFGENNVHIAIGKNANKDINFNRIIYHLTPYKINYVIADNITLSDYCMKNNINYIIRGIRNGVDAEYELKLDFLNKEINSNVQTLFFPTKDIFSNISSSAINELLKYEKYEIVKKYMNEEAMYRFINKQPEFIIFFGKSCVGKTYYLNNILFKNKNIKTVNVDEVLWDIFRKFYGENTYNIIKNESKNLIYNNKSINNLIEKYSTKEFWYFFFNYITSKYEKYNINEYINRHITNDAYILDFPAIGNYWQTIPLELRSKFYLINLKNNNKNRNNFINKKKFQDKIEYLDKNYKEPNYFDIARNINE